jgi:BMFP domain-containing protein YqiC
MTNTSTKQRPTPCVMAKDRAMTTPSHTTRERILEHLDVVKTTLNDFGGLLRTQLTRVDDILADLQRRVSALEQRQYMEETKRVAKNPHGKPKR